MQMKITASADKNSFTSVVFTGTDEEISDVIDLVTSAAEKLTVEDDFEGFDHSEDN